MRNLMIRPLIYLAAGLFSSVQALASLEQKPRWDEDGWRAEFASAHCYLGHSYYELARDEIGIVNINFIQVADRQRAESEYDFWLWRALDRAGIKQGELVFSAALPGRVSWRGNIRQKYTASLEVGGFETTTVDTKGLGENEEEQKWFIVREPDSKRLIEMFSAEQSVEFEIRLTDGSQATFEYRVSPDVDFKVRRAMFEACLSVLTQDNAAE